MGVLSFPFLFKNRAHANRVLADPAIAEKIADLLDAKGIIGCGQVATADVRYMTAQSASTRSPTSTARRCASTAPTPSASASSGFGVTSVPMNLADMITALQNGTIDGSGSGITIWVNFNLDTVSKELLQIEDTLIVSYCAHEQEMARHACRLTCARW